MIFATCQRLAKKAAIIIRFKELQQRNILLQNAKRLKAHEDKIVPDLPPVLRPMNTAIVLCIRDESYSDVMCNACMYKIVHVDICITVE